MRNEAKRFNKHDRLQHKDCEKNEQIFENYINLIKAHSKHLKKNMELI